MSPGTPLKPPAYVPPEPGPTATPYPEPGQRAPMPLWIYAEAATLARLAEHGGDLTAHRTVHQGETR